MMKKFLLLLFLSFGFISFGQAKKSATKSPVKPSPFKITFDKFSNEYTYSASAGAIGIYAIGQKDFNEIGYKALSFTVYDSYLTYASDVTILFSDGTTMKLESDEEMGQNSSTGLWRYILSFYPTSEQWRELSEKTITDFKLHIFDRNYKFGNQLKAIIKELIKNDSIE